MAISSASLGTDVGCEALALNCVRVEPADVEGELGRKSVGCLLTGAGTTRSKFKSRVEITRSKFNSTVNYKVREF